MVKYTCFGFAFMTSFSSKTIRIPVLLEFSWKQKTKEKNFPKKTKPIFFKSYLAICNIKTLFQRVEVANSLTRAAVDMLMEPGVMPVWLKSAIKYILPSKWSNKWNSVSWLLFPPTSTLFIDRKTELNVFYLQNYGWALLNCSVFFSKLN